MKRWSMLLSLALVLLILCSCTNSYNSKYEIRGVYPDLELVPTGAEADGSIKEEITPEENLTVESENMNTRSVYHRHGGLPTRGFSTYSSFYSAVRQENTIYLAATNALAKMPVGGGIDDLEFVGSRFSGSSEICEMQIVGEWIYFKKDGIYCDELWRIKTDGTNLEKITEVLAVNTHSNTANTFVVVGDLIYLTCEVQEQLSASEFKYISTLYCYQPDTGVARELYQTTSDKAGNNLIISAYNEKSLLLLDYSEYVLFDSSKEHPTLLIYEFDTAFKIGWPSDSQETEMNRRRKPYGFLRLLFCTTYFPAPTRSSWNSMHLSV